MKQTRINKFIASSGVCSRRDAEKYIQDGRVTVNGTVLYDLSFKVKDSDIVMVDDNQIEPEKDVRLFRYYKPKGLITSNRDEQGRKTIFDTLPKSLPRLITVGRLDFNSEGLLLLTNNGDVARHLELPSTRWVRKYKVRSYGMLKKHQIEELQKGVTVQGINYGGVIVDNIEQKGGNFWCNVSLTEGKNREIRKLFEHFDCQVNRLIRISYGPFQLGSLKETEIVEVTQKVIKEQLGKVVSKD